MYTVLRCSEFDQAVFGDRTVLSANGYSEQGLLAAFGLDPAQGRVEDLSPQDFDRLFYDPEAVECCF